MKKAKRKELKAAKKEVKAGLRAGDIVMRPVDDDVVAFHIFNHTVDEIIGHAKWTKRGRIGGKWLKAEFDKTRKTDEE